MLQFRLYQARSVATASMPLLLLVLLLAAGCHQGVVKLMPDPALDPLREIDAYRASDPPQRSLDHAISDDGIYTTIDDRPSTAALQSTGPILRVRLVDVMLTTLKNNRGIRVEDYDRSIARDGIEAARGIYDLLIEASAGYSGSESQGPVRATRNGSPLASRQRTHSLGMTLSQLVPSGGMLQFLADWMRVKNYTGRGAPGAWSIDPYDSISFTAQFSQPLLRGFGPYVTNAPIRVAGLQEEIATENFRDVVIDQLAASLNLYWDLVFAIDNYEVLSVSLKRAEELLRISRIKVDYGAEPPDIVLQAEAEVSRYEALVIEAQQAIADVSDALKQAMNITQDDEKWNYNLVPIDRPTVITFAMDENALIKEALSYRPDYRSAALAVEMAEIDERVKKNAKLPQLNASAGYTVTGLEDSAADAMDEVETVDYDGYNVGLTLSYPLQNRTARSQHRQALDALEQAREIQANLRDLIELEVRSAIRALTTNQNLIKAWDASVQSEKAKLESKIHRYEVGSATIFEVLDFQEDLADAQVRYLRSVVDFNQAMTELQRAKASFLHDYRVEVLDNPVAEREAAEAAAEGR